jgi:predicted dienelactone hydrolase
MHVRRWGATVLVTAWLLAGCGDNWGAHDAAAHDRATPDTTVPPDAGAPDDAAPGDDATADAGLDDAGANDDAGPELPVPARIGPYPVGHVSYLPTDSARANRAVAMSVFYPADPAGIDSSTPKAEYLFDQFAPEHGASVSADWEARGYDPAYEGPAPATDGPFPLVVFSPGWGSGSIGSVFLGTRLASHGFVVAVLDHPGECGWPWRPDCTNLVVTMVERPKDVVFAITDLLGRNGDQQSLLHSVIDPARIAMGGHSIGGYATLALAGGDDSVCDSLWPGNAGMQSVPYPPETCVATVPDPRIKAIVSLDSSAQAVRYAELARVGVPSLIMGQGPGSLGTGLWRTLLARPHAAIARPDSFRIDVDNSNHNSFANSCEGFLIAYDHGAVDYDWMSYNRSRFGCDPVLAPADAHRVITMYVVAFLDAYLRPPGSYQSILTPGYAATHTPTVQFIDAETCQVTLPDDSYFAYRPSQLASDCLTALKDPPQFF